MIRKQYRLFIFFLFFLSSIFVFGQDGPGGVGTTNGSSDLSLWLDANTITGIANNANMTGTWLDQSGNGNNAAIGTAPQYKKWGAGNGQSSLLFDASNSEYMQVTTNSEVMPTGELSVFVMANYETISSSWGSIISSYSVDAANDGWAFERETGTNQMRYYVDDYYNAARRCDHTITYGQNEVWSMVFNTTDNQVATYSSESNCNFNFNGPINYNAGGNNNVLLGAGWDDGGPAYFMEGDIGEVIIYDVAVNDAQRIIISNYLAAKYDIALSPNDVYNEDNAANGDYDHDVAGIGRTDASNIHDDAQGTGIVRMLNPTNLGNDEFLIWGHDNGVLQNTETTDIPVGVGARFDRVWRISEVNTAGFSKNVGNVDMRWDLSSFGTLTAANLLLLIDTDNDGIFSDETPISGANDLTGGIYEFSNVPGAATGLRNNRRFTLATISGSPLPIDLLSFNATPFENSSVKIDWQTTTEINNDYFTIERSIDVIDWETVNQIDGAGNSSNLIAYHKLDKEPYAGTSYYRLKQTDFDGKFSYSKTATVTIKTVNSISIYPNPAQNQIIISGDKNEMKSLQIYTALGKNATKLTSIIQRSETRLVVDISKLNSGIYFLKTETTANKIYKE